MNTLEIRYGRQFAPNVKAVSRSFLNQLMTWFKGGIGLGIVLFVALTTLTALKHGATWIQITAKQERISKLAEDSKRVIPRAAQALPLPVFKPVVVPEKKDYRVIREQNRLVTDLAGHLSRAVSRFVR